MRGGFTRADVRASTHFHLGNLFHQTAKLKQRLFARRFRQIHELNLKTSRAWALKESFSELWAYRYTKPAQRYFKTWCTRALCSQLKPIKAVTKMQRRHKTRILNYIKQRITNTAAEGFNSMIQTIKANARGFRCFENYRIRILFFCGKLGVMPDC